MQDSGVISQIISNTGAGAKGAATGGDGSKTTDGKEKPDEEMKDGDNDSDGGEDELDDEQLEKLEFIIQYLLDALKDDDNIVRWTAAKGIGRITMRLSKDFADQIVE